MADLNLKNVIKNNKYDILTPDGFSDFDGLLFGYNNTIIIHFTHNLYIECTPKHTFCKSGNKSVFAKDLLIGDSVETEYGESQVLKIENGSYKPVYDLLDVKLNHKYKCNKINMLQCVYLDEFAFIKHHIADEFIASVFPTISSGKTTKVIITSCVTADTYVFTNKGIEQVGDFIDKSIKYGGYNIPEYKVMGKKSEFNTGLIMHNDGYKETKIIECAYSKLESSLEHKYLSCKDGKYGVHKAKELSVGDFIAVKYGMNCWGNDDIDFIDKTEHKKCNHLGSINKLTPDLAYIIGLYISEGYARYQVKGKHNAGGSVVITCGDDVSDHLDKLNLRYRKIDKFHYVISSVSLVNFLTYLGFDVTNKAPKKEIPKRLMQLSKESTAAMISGIFDGDGCSDMNRVRIGIKLSSKKLIEQIRVLLLNFGILTTYTEGVIKPSELVKVSSYGYNLSIDKYEHVQRFFTDIGFRFERKQIKINNQLKSNRVGSVLDIIPFSYSRLKEIKKKYKVNHSIISFSGEKKDKEHFSRHKLLNIKNQLSDDILSKEPWFEIITDDIIWTKITSINSGNEFVYDFSLTENDNDYWANSVSYSGVLGFQTPAGMNHFYRMWQEAVEEPESGVTEDFVKSDIPWNAVPGRDENWAKAEQKRIGEIRFNQEYKCIDYNEIITIKHLPTGNISNISIGNLYDKFDNTIKNTDYEVLTPIGFKLFDGISRSKEQLGLTLIFNDGSVFECSIGHRIKVNNIFINAEHTLGLFLDNTYKKVSEIIYNDIPKYYYDLLDVKECNQYISSGLISHNCEFVGSVSTLIDHTFLKAMKHTLPMDIARLPSYVRVWQLPLPKERLERENWEYVASLDSGYGVHQDYTVMQICLVKSNITVHQVAKMWSNSMDIELFCKRARDLLKSYHDPALIIEQNGPGIAATTYFHSTVEYENLIHFDGGIRHMGLWATDKMKENAVILIKAYVQRDFIKLMDFETIDEFKSFGRVSVSKWGAMGGNHDDHITSLYWIPYYLNTPFYYGNVVEVNLQELANDEIILGVHKEENDDKYISMKKQSDKSNGDMDKIMSEATRYMDRGRFYKNPFDDDIDDLNSGSTVYRG